MNDKNIKRISFENLSAHIVKHLPRRQDNRLYWFGADLGYSDDPAEFVIFEEFNGVMKLIARVRLEHIDNTTQCDIIALLDRIYLFKGLGIDATGHGAVVAEFLMNQKSAVGWTKFAVHQFNKRMYPVNFSSNFPIGKVNGKPKDIPVKQFMTDLISISAQNRRLIMPCLIIDEDIENQFRNHTYVENLAGRIIYSKSNVFPEHIVDAVRTVYYAKAISSIPKYNNTLTTGAVFRSRSSSGGWR